MCLPPGIAFQFVVQVLFDSAAQRITCPALGFLLGFPFALGALEISLIFSHILVSLGHGICRHGVSFRFISSANSNTLIFRAARAAISALHLGYKIAAWMSWKS